MWQLIAYVGIMAAEYVYSNWMNPPKPVLPESQLTVPLAQQGTPIPLVYGRCRVTAPVLAYASVPFTDTHASQLLYQVDLLFVIGIGFQDGQSRVLQMFVGDIRLRQFSGSLPFVFLKDQPGNGNFEDSLVHLAFETPFADIVTTQGQLEFLNGGPTQQLVDPSTGSATTRAGSYMTTTAGTGMNVAVGDGSYDVELVDPFQVPGYRGYLCGFLWGEYETAHWAVGVAPQVASYSFEMRSLPPAFGLSPNGGDDANPVDIIVDLLTGTFAKIGEDISYLEMQTFVDAARTCTTEFAAISVAFQQQDTVASMLSTLLQIISGGMFENPTTGKLQIKLARADYDPQTVPTIDPTNCIELQNFAASGWTDIANRVVVRFIDRAIGYKSNTATSTNLANTVGQDGEVREITLDYQVVMSMGYAQDIADRELQARSKPLMKLRAIVNRSFLRTMPGDVVKLNWPEANISAVYFRVANVGRGTLENPNIALDLVQDSFFVRRQHSVEPPVGSTGGTFGSSL